MIEYNDPLKDENDMNILERLYWAVELNWGYENKVSQGNMIYRTDLTDKTVKACPCCKKTWEKWKEAGKHSYEYFTTIPSIGKEKVICPRCKSYGVGVLATTNSEVL
jgi:hypothetical protein